MASSYCEFTVLRVPNLVLLLFACCWLVTPTTFALFAQNFACTSPRHRTATDTAAAASRLQLDCCSSQTMSSTTPSSSSAAPGEAHRAGATPVAATLAMAGAASQSSRAIQAAAAAITARRTPSGASKPLTKKKAEAVVGPRIAAGIAALLPQPLRLPPRWTPPPPSPPPLRRSWRR